MTTMTEIQRLHGIAGLVGVWLGQDIFQGRTREFGLCHFVLLRNQLRGFSRRGEVVEQTPYHSMGLRFDARRSQASTCSTDDERHTQNSEYVTAIYALI